MRDGYDRILIAVRDIEQVTPRLLRKVAQLARSSRSQLEVYHAIAEPVVLVPPRSAARGANYQSVLAAAAARSRAQLEQAVQRARLKGLRVSCSADWDYPAFEAVVRRALAFKADLVVGVVHKHRTGGRVFLRNVDWELIRYCPVPLLLLKSTRAYRRSAVLAAVDPFHAADKPAKLDRQLLDTGARAANRLGGQLHVVHAWQPLSVAVSAVPGLAGPVWMPPEAETAHQRAIAKAFGRLAAAAKVPEKRRYLLQGSTSDAFAKVLRKTRAQMLVMGAVSRRGLARWLIGNTAERLLDNVSCDVLVVKPHGFRHRVSNKRRGPTPGILVPPL